MNKTTTLETIGAESSQPFPDKEGLRDAERLGLFCIVNEISLEKLSEMPLGQRLDWLEKDASMDVEAVIRAYSYISALTAARAEALRRYRQSHGHA